MRDHPSVRPAAYRPPLSAEAERARRRMRDWHEFSLVVAGMVLALVYLAAGYVLALMLQKL